MIGVKRRFHVLDQRKESNDVSELPKRNKLVLGATSLWMLLPMAHGAVHWSQGGLTHGQGCVVAALACACVSSVVFWSDARRGSTFHVLDRFSAVQYVVCAVLVSATGEGGRAVRAELQVLLSA